MERQILRKEKGEGSAHGLLYLEYITSRHKSTSAKGRKRCKHLSRQIVISVGLVASWIDFPLTGIKSTEASSKEKSDLVFAPGNIGIRPSLGRTFTS